MSTATLWTVKIEDVRDAVRGDTERASRIGIGIGRLAGHGRIVVARYSDENSSVRPGSTARRDAGVLMCLPRQFEQQPLLQIHLPGFTRRKAEEFGIEPVDPVEKTSSASVNAAGPVGIWVVPAEVPTVPLRFAHCVDSGFQRGPKQVGGIGATRIATTHTDDGDAT